MEFGARGDCGFYPIGYGELDKAHAFLRDQTEGELDDFHPQYYGVFAANGTHRAPLPSITEATDEECALINRIDTPLSENDSGADLNIPVNFCIPKPRSMPRRTPKSQHIITNNSQTSNGQGFSPKKGVRRLLADRLRANPYSIRYDERNRRFRSWKDTAKARRQFQRHLRRIQAAC